MNFESECESGFDLFLNNWEKSETKTFRPTLSKYFNWTWCFKHVSQTRRLNIKALLLFYFLNIINKIIMVREDSRATKSNTLRRSIASDWSRLSGRTDQTVMPLWNEGQLDPNLVPVQFLSHQLLDIVTGKNLTDLIFFFPISQYTDILEACLGSGYVRDENRKIVRSW